MAKGRGLAAAPHGGSIMLKAIATILSMVVALIVLGFVGYIWWTNHAGSKTVVTEQKIAGAATVNNQQTQAVAQAQKIVVSGEARNHLDIQVHQDNAHAIQAAPGANQLLDPDFVNAINRGLCHYASDASDPGCAGLHSGDTAELPATSP